MAYGEDHITGLFIQIFELSRADDDDEGIVVNLDQYLEGGLENPQKMCDIAEKYGFHIQPPEDIIQV